MSIYGLGILSLIFITHGMLIDLIGKSARHLPLYCGLVSCLIFLIKRQIHIRRDARLILFFALICIMFVSTLFSQYQHGSLLNFIQFVKAFFLAIIIFSVISKVKDIIIISKFILIGALIGVFMIIYHYASGALTTAHGTIQRAASLSADPNNTAMLLTMSLPIALFWIRNSGRRLFKAINIAGFMCILAGIILTQSRGGFITLIFIMGIYYVKNISVKTTMVAIVIVVLSIVFGAATGYWDRVGSLKMLHDQNQLHKDGSLTGRLDLAITGIKIFPDNFFIGSGPGQFGRKIIEYKRKDTMIHLRNVREYPAAHNLYLEFAVENGIFGIFVLSAILILSYRGFFELSKNGPDKISREIGEHLQYSFLALLVSGLFLSRGQDKSLWLMIGLGLALYNFKNSDG
jgi:O-antigen ligase